MPGNGGGHAFERILATPRAKDPGDRKSRQAAHGLNRAAAAGIDKTVAHGGS